MLALNRMEAMNSLTSSSRTILVTGAAGVVGSILLPHLARIGHVLALDVKTPDSIPSGVEWVDGSVADEELVTDLVRECRFVIHLARDDPSSWHSLATVDINGTRNVFSAAAKSAADMRVVYASSLHPVGGIERDHLADRLSETDEQEVFGPLRPDSEYAVAKAFGEAYGRFVAETSDVGVSCLRIGTVRAVDDPNRYLDEEGFRHIPGGRDGVARRLTSTWLHHDDLRTVVTDEMQAADRFRIRFAVSDHGFWPDSIHVWNPGHGG